jgi:hypothetical protein
VPTLPLKNAVEAVVIESWMREWSRMRACVNVRHWLRELLHSERAAYRLAIRKYRPTARKAEPSLRDVGVAVHNEPVSAEQVQRVLHLYFVERLSATAVGERIGRSPGTVRRIVTQYEQHKGSADFRRRW